MDDSTTLEWPDDVRDNLSLYDLAKVARFADGSMKTFGRMMAAEWREIVREEVQTYMDTRRTSRRK